MGVLEIISGFHLFLENTYRKIWQCWKREHHHTAHHKNARPSVLDVLKDMDIDISNRRGECYDNAANMSGVHSGLRACIKLLNLLIEWVLCTAHTHSI